MSNLLSGNLMKVMILGAAAVSVLLYRGICSGTGNNENLRRHTIALVSNVSSLVSWLQLDLADPESVAALAVQVDENIDRWICCTGILAYPDQGPEKSLRQLNAEKLQRDHRLTPLAP